MKIAIPVTPDGQIDPRFGKAHDVAVTEVNEDGSEILSWDVHQVNWDELHDSSPHGTHHGRIVRFLIDNGIEAVIINHAGGPMMNTLSKMGMIIVTEAEGDAQELTREITPQIYEAIEAESDPHACGCGGSCGCSDEEPTEQFIELTTRPE
ncbi:MAG: hypothetical protein LKK54_04660 [Ancrocorticia sp.]|jgi:predicted Fe-Mo cluster-binding NifX family protein|nr:hypothetical protein [Ancrocorticia sp.]MCI2199006.1 hypothetical protein [Ancrocorticia sp.]